MENVEYDDIIKVYNKINKSESAFINESDVTNKEISLNELNGIKTGDIIVFNVNDMEFKGSVSEIVNEKYIIHGNFSDDVKKMIIDFDQIIEHYPKNNKFMKKVEEDKLMPSIDPPFFKKDPNYNNKNKYVVFFKENMKNSEIEKAMNDFYKEAKYFIVDKNNETHIVRFKPDGFKIKQFVEGVLNHLITKKMISENISDMKLIGNDSFCIIKNPKHKTVGAIKSILKNILK